MYKVKEREGVRRCESRLRKILNVTDERKKIMEKGIKNVENKREPYMREEKKQVKMAGNNGKDENKMILKNRKGR